MKVNMESSSTTPTDYDFLTALEEYYENSIGTHTDRIANFSKYIRTQDLRNFLGRYELFKKIIDVPGSIIECGVLHGGGLMGFAQISSLLEPRNHTRKIIGFDTFAGFPSVSEGDKHSSSEFVKEGGLAVDSYEDLKKSIALFESNKLINHIPQVELIKGDGSKTIPKYVQENPHLVVSILYLDFDLYEPTKVALQQIVPRMPKGSIIVFDELNAKYWPGETKALLDEIGISKFRINRFNFDAYRAYTIIE